MYLFKILKALLPSSILTTWPAHLSLPDLITLTILGEWYKLQSSSLWSLLHSPFSSLLGPNTRLRILFSNTLSLPSSFNIKDHASQPYSRSSNIIVLYILIFKFLERKVCVLKFWKLSYLLPFWLHDLPISILLS